jgi:hypothetical protein
MRRVMIKTLPCYFGHRQHAYLPMYAIDNEQRPNLNKRGDRWQAYKKHAEERVFATWDGAFSFVMGKFNYDQKALYLAFQGQLPYYRVAERDEAIRSAKIIDAARLLAAPQSKGATNQ